MLTLQSKTWTGRGAVRFAAVLLMLGAGCYLGSVLWQYHISVEEYQDLRRQIFAEVKEDELSLPEEAKTAPITDYVDEQYTVVQKSVADLMQNNPDMIGWIAFDHLAISYPVMQGADNEYYLNHTFSGEKNTAGSIFADVINHRDWEDAHTIIYGHNMKNLSMFGRLRYYKQKEFWEKNPYFTIYTDRKTLRYSIFSCHEVEEYSDIYTVWYTPDENYEAMLDRMQKQSYYDMGVAVNSEDKILTLSTCSVEGRRLVIHAKRVEQTGSHLSPEIS